MIKLLVYSSNPLPIGQGNGLILVIFVAALFNLEVSVPLQRRLAAGYYRVRQVHSR